MHAADDSHTVGSGEDVCVWQTINGYGGGVIYCGIERYDVERHP